MIFFFFTVFLKVPTALKQKTRRDLVILQNQRFSTHTKISLHVQIVQMETCICSINCQECSLRVALQNPSAEKYGVKKPQGMRAVCSPCSASVSVLHFQNSSQAARTERGKGCVKTSGGGGVLGNKSLNFRATVQNLNPAAVAHDMSGVWTCT